MSEVPLYRIRLFAVTPAMPTSPECLGGDASFDVDKALPYRGTSLIRHRLPLGPYSRPEPRALWSCQGGCAFL